MFCQSPPARGTTAAAALMASLSHLPPSWRQRAAGEPMPFRTQRYLATLLKVEPNNYFSSAERRAASWISGRPLLAFQLDDWAHTSGAGVHYTRAPFSIASNPSSAQ